MDVYPSFIFFAQTPSRGRGIRQEAARYALKQAALRRKGARAKLRAGRPRCTTTQHVFQRERVRARTRSSMSHAMQTMVTDDFAELPRCTTERRERDRIAQNCANFGTRRPRPSPVIRAVESAITMRFFHSRHGVPAHRDATSTHVRTACAPPRRGKFFLRGDAYVHRRPYVKFAHDQRYRARVR